ncbi:unnamed protein product [Cylicocyclus nassatus]|uniref:Laminin G domain-containing protein n=1 Tax=Cylicocyclus nassatus TaxID=53992 RepID=A0AA36HA12_CYLNA|nr:unnamed protein product [Cylicocyclus nassatus]
MYNKRQCSEFVTSFVSQSKYVLNLLLQDVLWHGNGTKAGTHVESEEIFEKCCGAKDHIPKKDPGHFDDGAFFDGTHEYAYLSGGNKPIFSSTTSDFSFEFRANSSDGILWSESEWLGSGRSDFLIIHLRKGKVNVAVNLGNDRLKPVSTNKSVVRGKWHRVAVERREHRTTVNVDGKLTTIISSEGATQLNTNGLVYLGGRLGNPKRFRIKGTFVGCIRRVKINGIRINLLHDVISAQPPLRCHPTLV